MTFLEFQKTKQYRDTFLDEYTDEPVEALVYGNYEDDQFGEYIQNQLHIAIVDKDGKSRPKHTWEQPLDFSHYSLLLDRSEYVDANLQNLEVLLYDWAVESGWMQGSPTETESEIQTARYLNKEGRWRYKPHTITAKVLDSEKMEHEERHKFQEKMNARDDFIARFQELADKAQEVSEAWVDIDADFNADEDLEIHASYPIKESMDDFAINLKRFANDLEQQKG